LTIRDLIEPTNTRKIEFWKSKFEMSLDYIFGSQTAGNIDYEDLAFQFSNRTGRPRQIVQKDSGDVLFSFRPNGSIAPTIIGAKLLWRWGHLRKKVGVRSRPRWVVTVIDGVTEVVAQGKTVFCKHVFYCDDSLRPNEDVAIMNQKGELLAVGRTTISGLEMKQFKRGVAVKVRQGISQIGSRNEF
jgi:predicted RNA-binding protein (TIGR00451 family)